MYSQLAAWQGVWQVLLFSKSKCDIYDSEAQALVYYVFDFGKLLYIKFVHFE